jgi:hypothetical protein
MKEQRDMEPNLDLRIEEIGRSAANASGNEIRLRVTLTNISTGDRVLVNGRMLLSGRTTPEQTRDIWLDIVYEGTTSSVDFLCGIRGGAPTKAEYRVLHPGEALSIETDLRCFPPKLVGPLRVRAHIDVGVPEEILPRGTKTPVLPLTSNQITVRAGK